MNKESSPLQIRVERLAYGGEAVGHLPDGMTAFVRGALPGELVEVIIELKKRNFARCRLLRIIEVSPRRIAVRCPNFFTPERGVDYCPGCAYLHLDYADELKYKQEQFADFLLRDKLIAPEAIAEPFGAPERFGLRNKLKLSSSGSGYGYFQQDNETVLPVTDCPLAHPEIRKHLPELAAKYNSPAVTLRHTTADGVVVSPSGITSGKTMLTETIDGYGTFQVAADGFFQTNLPAAAELVRRVTGLLQAKGTSELLELYCGVGVFSIAAAQLIPQLRCTGVELNARAISSAQVNARCHKVAERCRFFAADAGKWLLKNHKKLSCDTVLVDPPRSGMEKQTLESIAALRCRYIIYVSCAPDTLRRDLMRFREKGYAATGAGLLDMFPGTAHFESITVLEPQKNAVFSPADKKTS